jgi:hypothetical protein
MIPELFMQVVTAIVRWALQGAFTFLVARGVLTEDLSSKTLVWVAGAVVVLLWSIYEKYKGRLHFTTALSLPAGSTTSDVRAAIKAKKENS